MLQLEAVDILIVENLCIKSNKYHGSCSVCCPIPLEQPLKPKSHQIQVSANVAGGYNHCDWGSKLSFWSLPWKMYNHDRIDHTWGYQWIKMTTWNPTETATKIKTLVIECFFFSRHAGALDLVACIMVGNTLTRSTQALHNKNVVFHWEGRHGAAQVVSLKRYH